MARTVSRPPLSGSDPDSGIPESAGSVETPGATRGRSNRVRTEKQDSQGVLKGMLSHPLADYAVLQGATLTLVVLGLAVVLSASSVYSLKVHGSSYTLFSRQLMFAVAGFIAMYAMSRMPVMFFRRISKVALIASTALVAATLVIGTSVNGQKNWISVGGPFRIQPAEMAKLALIIWCADVLARKQGYLNNWKDYLVPIAPVAGGVVALVLIQGDMGTAMVIVPIVGLILYVSGAPIRLFGAVAGLGITGVAMLTLAAPYRLQRFQSWLDPASDPTGAGWQVIRGQYGLATGGWWGVGLGASREKWGSLPEAHTDFIYAVVGEEFGLMGTLSVLFLFGLIALIAVRIAFKTQDSFVRLATSGVIAWIVVQMIINIGAVLGILPIAGLPLPLVSYGGSSLVFCLMAIGMLMAFARSEPEAQELIKQETVDGARKVGRVSRSAAAVSGAKRQQRLRKQGATGAGRGDKRTWRKNS